MRKFIGLAAMLCAAALPCPVMAQAPAKADCTPISGAQALWSRAGLKWLVVGEVHGSVEMPAAFADLVCLAAANSGRPIVVGIELPPSEQPRLDAYMASDGSTQARAALLEGPFWHPTMFDGRSSGSWVDLIEQMRRYKAQGRIERLVAVRRYGEERHSEAAGEAAFADAIRELASGDRLALVYVGTTHAAIRRPNGLPFDPAAAQLPGEAVYSLYMVGSGGTSWNCQPRRDGAPGSDCGPHEVPQTSQPFPREIRALPEGAMPWSALFTLGGPVSASPPAAMTQEKAAR